MFLPQAFDEDDNDETSESNQYIAEGQRVVNRALQQRTDGGEVGALLNLAHYVPSTGLTASGALVRAAEGISMSHISQHCRSSNGHFCMPALSRLVNSGTRLPENPDNQSCPWACWKEQALCMCGAGKGTCTAKAIRLPCASTP